MFDRMREAAKERQYSRELREILQDVARVQVGAWRMASNEGERPAYVFSGPQGHLWIAQSTYIQVARGTDDETYPNYRIYGDSTTVSLAANRVVSITSPDTDAVAVFDAIHQSPEQAQLRASERSQKLALQERRRSMNELRDRLCELKGWIEIPDGFTAVTDKGARVRVVETDAHAELTIDGDAVPFSRGDVAVVLGHAYARVRAEVEAAARDRARAQDPIRDRFLDKF